MGIFGESKKEKLVKALIRRVESMCARNDTDAAIEFINEELRVGRIDKRMYTAAYAVIENHKHIPAANMIMRERAKQKAYATNANLSDAEKPQTDVKVFADWVFGDATDADVQQQMMRNQEQHEITEAMVSVRAEIKVFNEASSKPTVKGKIGVLRTFIVKGCVAGWGTKKQAYEILCRACEQGIVTYDEAQILLDEIREYNA